MSDEHPLQQLQALGQSPWQDTIQRRELEDGTLARRIAAGEITGLTSNPSIFEAAIAKSDDYDHALRDLALAGKAPLEIFDALAIEDIRDAADAFAGVYQRTSRADGYVSIEVAPNYANDTETTLSEARRLWAAVDRPNLMIKIPATRAGLPAIMTAISEGINVNVTLIFSLKRYREVMSAYLDGLKLRAANGAPVDHVASVASFFVSRLDTLIDSQLQAKIDADPSVAAALTPLMGKAAVANARLAYALYEGVFGDGEFAELKARGAMVQRPLWASTSTKNPAYPDTLYVDNLIGPDTVNTMPLDTLYAFKEHGVAQPTVRQGLDEAREVMDRLAVAGIDMDAATQQLEDEGVAKFFKSFDNLLDILAERSQAYIAEARSDYRLGSYVAAVDAKLAEADAAKFGARLWQQDSTLWKPDDAAHQAEIKVRMGWLTVAEEMRARIDELNALRDEVYAAGFRKVVLGAMGGSSLAPDVLYATFGKGDNALELRVLDSTHPTAVQMAHDWSEPAETLYIVASKSGGTTETLSFYRYFHAEVAKVRGDGPAGENFIAITDPGSKLEAEAAARNFRRCYLNPATIGGRFSALSLFGLVPAALIGLDLEALLDRARDMALASAGRHSAAANAGVRLGVTLGALGQAGRDKITFVVSEALATYGYWVEQLIAESTGKEGLGLLPVEGEALGRPDVYSDDRVFVYLRLDDAYDARLDALAAAGHPVIRLDLRDPYDIAAEFLRWEIATAAMGWVLGINPFDQPNVQSAKTFTKALLADPAWVEPEPSVRVDDAGLKAALDELLGTLQAGDYVGLMAYTPTTPATETALAGIRNAIRNRYRVATTVGYGPRFLHSTGQLHKGGANNGVFLQMVTEAGPDLAIPGADYGFSRLVDAQSLGDFQALQAEQRRVLRVVLPMDFEAGLGKLQTVLAS